MFRLNAMHYLLLALLSSFFFSSVYSSDFPTREFYPQKESFTPTTEQLQLKAELQKNAASLPWITIPCKFSNVSTEPHPLAYYQAMYDQVPGGLIHYWQEVSYGNMDISGSTAIDWLSLPRELGYYIDYVPHAAPDLNKMFNDCVLTLADSIVDFTNNQTGGYGGIIIVLNENWLQGAYGARAINVFMDGILRDYPVAFIPKDYQVDVAIAAHEMGHGIGMDHSNNSDRDANPYDNPWDVMSYTAYYNVHDPFYGYRAQHMNAYQKYGQGWYQPHEILVSQPGPPQSFIIDAASLANTPNYRIAKVNTSDPNRYYTIEVRKPIGPYDGQLPTSAVLIHEVWINGRVDDSWIVDGDVPPATFSNNPGVMWVTGETYNQGEFRVYINTETANGFMITITHERVYGNGFE